MKWTQNTHKNKSISSDFRNQFSPAATSTPCWDTLRCSWTGWDINSPTVSSGSPIGSTCKKSWIWSIIFGSNSSPVGRFSIISENSWTDFLVAYLSVKHQLLLLYGFRQLWTTLMQSSSGYVLFFFPRIHAGRTLARAVHRQFFILAKTLCSSSSLWNS